MHIKSLNVNESFVQNSRPQQYFKHRYKFGSKSNLQITKLQKLQATLSMPNEAVMFKNLNLLGVSRDKIAKS